VFARAATDDENSHIVNGLGRATGSWLPIHDQRDYLLT
jgi:hypothetical protein